MLKLTSTKSSVKKRQEPKRLVTSLTVSGLDQDCGFLVKEFWTCKCEFNHIHQKEILGCQKCGQSATDGTDALLHEVLARYPSCYNLVWKNQTGDIVSKLQYCERLEQHVTKILSAT